VTAIGNSAFRSNTSLTSITIPDSVTSIGSEAFRYDASLATVNCYTTLTSIGSDAFYLTADPLTIHTRALDSTWTAGAGLSIGGNSNVTVIKDL
jgi:hypothetical protein